jgi:hypothetical protein
MTVHPGREIGGAQYLRRLGPQRLVSQRNKLQQKWVADADIVAMLER